MFFHLYKMYQQPIQGQNQKIVYQYNNVPITQNQNQLLANNQLQYPRQLAPQQGMQRNQAQIQNIQQPQQPQNIQNLQNTQMLNAQKYQQVQNMQKMHKHQQAQKIQNPQIPHNINTQQVPLGQNTQKTYAVNQIQKTVINPQVVQNPMTQQNVLYQTNINQGQTIKPQTNAKKQIAASHLNLSQTPTLEPTPQIPNQPHLQIQQKHHHHHHTNQNQNQIQPQKQQMTENLKNTAFLSVPQNQQNNQNPTLIKPQPNKNQQKNDSATKKSATLMTVNSLANIPYDEYPDVEYSKRQAYNIIAFAANSYNGKIKKYNEDTYKRIVGVEKDCIINGAPQKKIISYFGLFDGHGGDKCSIFLKNNFHEILFNLNNFPANPIESIRDAFNNAENQFYHIAVSNGKLVDKSGSCATIALIIDNILYSINLGDSRALYSRDGGKEFYQITRDHKPNDEIERKRIEKYGGKVFYANKTVVNGVEITLKEEDFGKGFTFPYRLLPSGLAVSFFIYNNLGSKNYW